MSLKEELIEMVDTFDYFNIPEEKQRSLVSTGKFFEVTRNSGIKLNGIRLAKFMRFCESIDGNFDVNDMLQSHYDEYAEYITLFIKTEGKGKDKIKTKSIDSK